MFKKRGVEQENCYVPSLPFTRQSKAYGSHANHSYCHPMNQHWGACAPLRHLSLVQANPPVAGLVTCGRIVQVSQIEVAEPKAPQQLHTAKRDKDNWAFASPVYTRYQLRLQLGGLLPQLTPGHQFPIYTAE